MNTSRAWVAVGDGANWERGFENGIWGLRVQLEHHWNRIEAGDIVLFYCIAPIKGFVGAGVIRSKFRQTEPYWKEELESGNIIWPFRFEFDISHLLPLGSWKSSSVSNRDFNLAILAGLNPITDLERAFKVLEKLQFAVIKPANADKEIVSTIYEIGKIQRMVVESGFQVEDNYLDVIWKRTIRSVPTFAFAVNTDDDLDKSLKSLKHAFDVWNSRPFIITTPKRLNEISERVVGAYHEFAGNLKALTIPQVQELYESKKRYFDLEEMYGLR